MIESPRHGDRRAAIGEPDSRPRPAATDAGERQVVGQLKGACLRVTEGGRQRHKQLVLLPARDGEQRFDADPARDPLQRDLQGDLPAPVRDLTVTDRYLWVATDSGLVRLDRCTALGR